MMINKIFRLALLLLLPLSVEAIGFRDIVVDSFLGEPLKARIQLVSVDTAELDDLEVDLAEQDEFEKAGVSRPFILSKLRFKVAAGRAGDATIFITSRESIRETFLNFLIAIDWKGLRVLREYTVLLDPPSYRPAVVTAPLRPTVATAVPPKQKPTEPVTGGESYGPVKRSETLWVIAKKMRPDSSISVEQMMMAIQSENPDAFDRGNVNLLKRGAMLSVPDRKTIEQLTRVEAKSAFLSQVREWKAFRSGKRIPARPRKIEKQPTAELPPAAVPAITGDAIQPKQREPQQSSDTTVQQPAVADIEKPQKEPEARLRVVETGKEWPVVGSETSSDESSPLKQEEKLQTEIIDSQQDLKAVREINRDLAELRTALEARIDALRSSLEEKNRVIDRLVKRLEEMAASSAGIQGGRGNETASAKQKKVTPGSVSTHTEIESSVRKAPPPARPAERKPQLWGLDWIMHYWLPLLAVVMILLVLLLALLIRKRHVERIVPGPDAFSSYVELEEKPKPEQAPARKMDQDIVKAYDDDDGLFLEAGADVASALTEADIYLAYRRYSQAEALITESIAAIPDSMVLRAKLLEIYAFRKDKKRFVSFMEEIYQPIVAEAPEIWAKVVEMGRDLAPEHPLINGALLPEEMQGDVGLPDVISFPMDENDNGKSASSSKQEDGISILHIDLDEDDEEDDADKR